MPQVSNADSMSDCHDDIISNNRMNNNLISLHSDCWRIDVRRAAISSFNSRLSNPLVDSDAYEYSNTAVNPLVDSDAYEYSNTALILCSVTHLSIMSISSFNSGSIVQ